MPSRAPLLLASNPAIDAGDPGFSPPPEFDQRRNVRLAHGTADGVARIDMGALEVLLGDLNGDGHVDGLDVDRFVDALLGGAQNAAADMMVTTTHGGLTAGRPSGSMPRPRGSQDGRQ